jgi:hypothetical protein
MACLMVIDIEPLLIFVRLRERVHENREKVNRNVVAILGVNIVANTTKE